MRFQLISLAVFAVLLVSLTVRVDSTCTGIFPPYVPYPTSNFDVKDMSACCWFNDNTCCGLRGQIFDMDAIAQQINDIAARGISDQCYIKLSSLFCFWCDPNTVEFLAPPNDAQLKPTATLYLCPSFCKELFYKCFNDLDKLVNDFTQLHTATQFCEDIMLDNFYNNNGDLFPDFRIVVSNDERNCMRGIDDDEIETEAGICLPIPDEDLVDEDHVFDPIVFAPISPASILMVTSSVVLLFLTSTFIALTNHFA